VSVARNEDISLAVNECLANLEIPDLNGKKVLLKPNVGRETNSRLGINKPRMWFRASSHYFSKRFKAEFFIGDSPIVILTREKAFSQSGYSDLLRETAQVF